jgi:hypothetical protein
MVWRIFQGREAWKWRLGKVFKFLEVTGLFFVFARGTLGKSLENLKEIEREE